MTDPTSSTSPSAVYSATVPAEQPKFELFPKLPPELRLKIWNLIPESRVVEVIFKMDHRKNNYKFLATFPAILHVSMEARAEGLRRYTRVFHTKWALNGVFFDFEADILTFCSYAGESQKDLFLRKVKPAELAQVQIFVASGWDINRGGSFRGMKKLMCLSVDSSAFGARYAPNLNPHKCGVAGDELWFHELEDLMVHQPDKQHALKETISNSETWYGKWRAAGKQWQEPEGCSIVYVTRCDKRVQGKSYVL